MLDALIAGERDPRQLADLARGRMRTKRTALVEELRGRFDDHHAELVRMLLDQIDALNGQIATLTARIEVMLRHGDDRRRPSAIRPSRRPRRPLRAHAATQRRRPPRRNPGGGPGAPRSPLSPRSGWT